MKVPRKKKKKIPKGLYCYKFTGTSSKYWNEEYQMFVTGYDVKYCPFHFNNKLGYGDCKLMKGLPNGEKELDLLLDDSCKSCGNNYGKIN